MATSIESIGRFPFEEIAPELQAMLKSRVERLGYFGEFFQYSARQPDILKHFLHFTDALKVALPERLTEAAVLTVACMMGNAYERNQHERLSRKLGFGEAWIAAVEQLSPDRPVELSEDDWAVQRFVVSAIETRGKGSAAEFDAMLDVIGPDQSIAIMFLVGRYITHALFVNVLRLTPPVPSIFESPE